MARLTDAEYAELAADYAANPVRADEIVGPITVYPERLRNGRPAGSGEAKGNTPAISVRFPADMRRVLVERATAEDAPAAEVIRRAVAEYLDRHSA